MGKFPEADSRLFKNVFICKVCKTKTKAPMLKVLAGKVSCSNPDCKSKKLRPKKKK